MKLIGECYLQEIKEYNIKNLVFFLPKRPLKLKTKEVWEKKNLIYRESDMNVLKVSWAGKLKNYLYRAEGTSSCAA